MTSLTKKFFFSSLLVAMASVSQAAQCDYTAKADEFKLSFTGYGFPDKSYDVKDNTFTDYKIDSPNGKLLNGSIVINSKSVDTSADKRNWDRNGDWPEPTVTLRNMNIVNGLFGHFADEGAIKATVTGITADALELSVTMNGVTKTTTLAYTVEGGVLSAKGTVDLADYNTDAALKTFAALCSAAWHRGKTWTDIDIFFTVPVNEPGC